ncbi:MAG: hypothetical protein RLY86_4292 [Pseudomonadota bacterium]|jgi:uracil-DNA glycosylase family 4
MAAPSATPSSDCPLCPRLAAFRGQNKAKFPAYHNAPVPSFGPVSARLLIVGLAPGLHGANQTGRPFTGDWAGDLLYETLGAFGFAAGTYAERADDGLTLVDTRITNAARCVPPENKPTPEEVRTCRRFLLGEIASLPGLKAVVALGQISHTSVVAAFGGTPSRVKFAHGAVHPLSPRVTLFDSYHCSRYNTNTGRLTPEMFQAVFRAVRAHLDA